MRALVALCVRHFGAVTALTPVGARSRLLGRAAVAAGCVSRVRAFAGRHPDRGAGIRPAAGRGTGHQAGRECRQRRGRPRDAAFGVDSRTFGRHDHVRGRHRRAHRAPGHFGASVRAGQHAAGGRGHAEALAAGLEHHGSAEDRLVSDKVDAYDAARYGRLDHQTAAAGGAGRRACHRVRRRRAPDPDPARHAQAGQLRLHARPTCRMRRARRCRCAARDSSTSPRNASCCRSPTPAPDAERDRPGGRRGAQRHADPAARRRRGQSRARRCAPATR